MFLTNETLQAICRTFLHSIWQGMIAAALAGIILWITRHSSARKRYNLLGTLLLLSLVTSGITLYIELDNTASAIANITSATFDNGAAVLPSYPGELILQYVNIHANWFMLAWAIIFLLKFFRLAGGFYYIYRIRRTQVQTVTANWEASLLRLSNALGIRKAVRLFESGIVKTPLTIGFLKPVIFFPIGLLAQLPADQVETILLHELAHIRRKDYFINMLQSLMETIFFFNPAFLWISACLREEREACCDDIVVAHTPHKATYLHALVAFEGQATSGSILQLRLGSTQNQLLHRVKRMLTRENKKLSIMEKISLTFGLVAITAFSFMPEKEPVKPVPVSLHSAESLMYHLQPMQDTVPIVKQDKSVNKPAPSERRKNKRVVEFPKPRKADKRVTEKRERGEADKRVVEFPKPAKADTWATEKRKPGKADKRVIEKRKPGKADKWAPEKTEQGKADKWAPVKTEPGKADKWAPKKKATSTDTIQFPKPAAFKKDKTSSSPVAEANVRPYKEWIEADPESKIEKKKLLAMAFEDKIPKKKVTPVQKPVTEIIKKKKEITREGSIFFDEYLPESLRQKKALPPGKGGC